MSKKNTYDLEGDASFKQSWRIAHNFARQSEALYPDYEHKKLASLFNGAIFYYHKNQGKMLSKKDASDLITNEPPVPQYYIDEINNFLKSTRSSVWKKNESNENPDESSNPLLDMMKEDIEKE
jgi:hypothetical protein